MDKGKVLYEIGNRLMEHVQEKHKHYTRAVLGKMSQKHIDEYNSTWDRGTSQNEFLENASLDLLNALEVAINAVNEERSLR